MDDDTSRRDAGPADHDAPPADLHAGILDVLLTLVGPERAGPPSLWIVLLDADRRPLPVVLPLVGIPLRPDPAQVRQVVLALADVLAHDAPGGSLAVAVVRAAGGDRGSFERAWEQAVRTAAADLDVRVGPVVAIGEHRARVLSG